MSKNNDFIENVIQVLREKLCCICTDCCERKVSIPNTLYSKMVHKSLFAFVAVCSWSVAYADQTAHELCAKAYADSMREVENRSTLVITIRDEYQKICKSNSKKSTSSITGSLKSVIESVPVVGEWAASHHVQSDSRFCSVYEENAEFFIDSDYTYTKPAIEAQRNFNQCMLIAGSGNVSVTHSHKPGSVVFHFRRHDSETDFMIQGLATNTFTCTIPGVEGDGKDKTLDAHSVVKIDRNFNIFCTRAGELRGEDTYYSYDNIQIGTNLASPYSVEIFEETIYGPAKQSMASKNMQRLTEEKLSLTRNVAKLLNEIEDNKLEVHFFYVHSGPRGLSRPIGTLKEWGFAQGNSVDVTRRVKQTFCPNAYTVKYFLAYSESGNCCGNHQYVVACSSANPVLDSDAGAQLNLNHLLRTGSAE